MILSEQLTLRALPGIPMVQRGDNLPQLILDALGRTGLSLEPGDVLVVSSKIVSKSEGRWLDLRTLTPSARAQDLAVATEKDPQLVEAILQEAVGVSRYRPGVLIVRHRLGFTSANAGIDHSNVGSEGEHVVLLLPEDPDASARVLRAALLDRTGVAPGVLISDTHGRPFRVGNVGVAIGLAGLPAVLDYRGEMDLFGRELRATVIAAADAVASAAGLVTGEASEGRPVVLVRGLQLPAADDHAADLVRSPVFDLYR